MKNSLKNLEKFKTMKLARSYMVESTITTVALQIELIKETKQDFTVKIHFLLK